MVSRYSTTKIPSVPERRAALEQHPQLDPLAVDRALERLRKEKPVQVDFFSQFENVNFQLPPIADEIKPSEAANEAPEPEPPQAPVGSGRVTASFFDPPPEQPIIIVPEEQSNLVANAAERAASGFKKIIADATKEKLSPAQNKKKKQGNKHRFSLRNLVFLIASIAFLCAVYLSQNPQQNPFVQTASQPSLTGEWEMRVYSTPNTYVPSNLYIKVQDHQGNLKGRGDELTQRFLVRGKFVFPDIAFNTKYESSTLKNGGSYKGTVDLSLKKISGYFYPINNSSPLARFRAKPAIPFVAVYRGPCTASIFDTYQTPEEWLGLMQLFGLYGVGLALLAVAISANLFGHTGIINMLSKKEFIPSQFREDYNVILRQFGSPLAAGGLPLGTRMDWNMFQVFKPKKLSLPPDLREANPNFLMLGTTAKGKSRLAASMICHDIESGDRAVVVVDTDGGLIDLLLRWMSSTTDGRKHLERVTLLDPARQTKVFFNPLEVDDQTDLQSAASAVVNGFRAIYAEPPGSQSQWTPQTANILRSSCILLMANGRTLCDLPLLLSDNDFRDVLLEKIERQKEARAEYTTLLESWVGYKRLARTEQWISWVEPILNRVQPVLGDSRIRPVIGPMPSAGQSSKVDLKEIIDKRKILLVKIPQGRLDGNGNLLGALIVSGLRHAAMLLSDRGPKNPPCAIYIDEISEVISKETYHSIANENKHLGLGIIALTKTLQALPEDFRNTLLINCGTLACFSLAKKDADLLGPQMFRVDGRKVKFATLQNLVNKVNTSPQFELIQDEEKLNIDRIVGQEEQTYFCYRLGTVAGVFHLRAPDFSDIDDTSINWEWLDRIYTGMEQKATKSTSGGDR